MHGGSQSSTYQNRYKYIYFPLCEMIYIFHADVSVRHRLHTKVVHFHLFRRLSVSAYFFFIAVCPYIWKQQTTETCSKIDVCNFHIGPIFVCSWRWSRYRPPIVEKVFRRQTNRQGKADMISSHANDLKSFPMAKVNVNTV